MSITPRRGTSDDAPRWLQRSTERVHPNLPRARAVGCPAMRELASYREEFPVLDRKTYLISASLGPLSNRSRRLLDGYLDAWAGKGAQHVRHVRQITDFETHIAGMTGRGGPDIGVAQRVRDRAIAAGALAEYATTAGAAAPVLSLDRWQHLMQEKVLPRTHRRRVDVLIAAEARKTIRKSHNNWRHLFLADQAVEPHETLLDVVAQIGIQLGRVVERKRSEKQLRNAKDEAEAATTGEAVTSAGVRL